MAKDVIVVVQRDALPTEKESLDILLVSTTGEYPVDTYRDVASVEAVYGPDGPCPNAKIVRKATTLFNQGKTTLAETLLDKFKIVSFAPPSASPATTASFAVTFAGAPSIEASKTLWARIGGDDKAVVEITTTDAVTTAEQLAALFADTSFTKGGKTYTAAVEGAVVRYTATEGGEADTIPEMVDVFEDELLSAPVVVEAAAEFVNGTDMVSAADNLINAIKQFQSDVDNDWYYLLTDRDEDEYVIALAKFAEASEPSEAELGAGVEDHRKFYMGQTSNKKFASVTSRAAVIYTDEQTDTDTLFPALAKDMDLIDRLGGIYEVVPKGYSKGTAIDFILKHFGLGLDDAYVFGDSSNDLAMFTYGKHTVALGHHDPVLDPYTEYVTDTVENDGLMKAMAHYGLI